jgi:hypothetical protein
MSALQIGPIPAEADTSIYNGFGVGKLSFSDLSGSEYSSVEHILVQPLSGAKMGSIVLKISTE